MVIFRVADETTDGLTRINDSPIIWAKGDGVRDWDILAVGVFVHAHFEFAHTIPDPKFVNRFVCGQNVTVPFYIQLNIVIRDPAGPEFDHQCGDVSLDRRFNGPIFPYTVCRSRGMDEPSCFVLCL